MLRAVYRVEVPDLAGSVIYTTVSAAEVSEVRDVLGAAGCRWTVLAVRPATEAEAVARGLATSARRRGVPATYQRPGEILGRVS